MSETKSQVKFEKELEIILVVPEIDCVERIVNYLKSKHIPSEVFWLRDVEQAVDYIESRNAYSGKVISTSNKLFVIDPKFGIDKCLIAYHAFNKVARFTKSHFFVLNKNLSIDDYDFLTDSGIELIDENFEIELWQAKLLA